MKRTFKLLAFATLALLPLGQRAYAGGGFSTLATLSGENPVGLTLSGGALYGATQAPAEIGGTCGTVFALQPPGSSGGGWIEHVLYSFG